MVDGVFFGYAFALLRASRELGRQSDALTPESIAPGDPLLALPQGTLEPFLDADIGRILRIEDKAKSNVMGIATSTALVGLAVGFYTRDNVFPLGCVARLLAGICVVLSLGFFLLSSILAVTTYSISEIARPDMEDALPATSEGEFKRILLYCIRRNRLTATRKANSFFVSIRFIQNGTVLIGLWGILAVLAAMN
jgi:hypothetical protein